MSCVLNVLSSVGITQCVETLIIVVVCRAYVGYLKRRGEGRKEGREGGRKEGREGGRKEVR